MAVEPLPPTTQDAIRALRTGLDLILGYGIRALAAGDLDGAGDALDEADVLLDAIAELLPTTPPVRL